MSRWSNAWMDGRAGLLVRRLMRVRRIVERMLRLTVTETLKVVFIHAPGNVLTGSFEHLTVLLGSSHLPSAATVSQTA